MPAAKYVSFQIKNTASVPMKISFTDPEGTPFSIGPIDPGSESIQVAPIGTIWSIEFVSSEKTKEGSEGIKEGSEGIKEGSEGIKEGSEGIKEGSEGIKEGSEGIKGGTEADN